MNVLNSYSITDRLLVITADNVFNNEVLHTELTALLHKWRINWSADMNTVNCMTHVFQLSVNTLLHSLKVSVNNDNSTKKWDVDTLSQLKQVCEMNCNFDFTF